MRPLGPRCRAALVGGGREHNQATSAAVRLRDLLVGQLHFFPDPLQISVISSNRLPTWRSARCFQGHGVDRSAGFLCRLDSQGSATELRAGHQARRHQLLRHLWRCVSQHAHHVACRGGFRVDDHGDVVVVRRRDRGHGLLLVRGIKGQPNLRVILHLTFPPIEATDVLFRHLIRDLGGHNPFLDLSRCIHRICGGDYVPRGCHAGEAGETQVNTCSQATAHQSPAEMGRLPAHKACSQCHT
mmetsp:Transcript_12502/g.26972  ORF Transcript_12502/g.26972 Transcript_12502/m.26972 type:complete len:242 (-) Transcript_12502:1-726(-)